MLRSEPTRSEIQIVHTVARSTISFRKRTAPLSKAVLERQTGLKGLSVLQAILELTTRGFISEVAEWA